MKCNIDAKGRSLRLLIGSVSAFAGIALLGHWWWNEAQWSLPIGIAASAGGAFAIFEGAAGWCALRAIGVRTRF